MRYTFRAKVWKYKESAGWHFVTLPKTLSQKIRKQHGLSEEGWGRLKTKAKTGKYAWNTAIWYDSSAGRYLLPLKAAVRKREDIKAGAAIEVTLRFQADDNDRP